MSRKQPAPRRSSGFTQGVARVLILIITCILIYLCLVLPDVINQANMPVAVGEVANQDILAPYSITYESKVYTERARMEAAAAVPPVFLPPDPSIARRQLETLNSILYYISTVRNDPYATREQKLEDLEALDEIKLNPSIAAQILALNDQDWQNIDKEARRVLELVMRDTIRNENVAQIRSNLPAIIDFAFPTEQAQVVIALVSPLIVPTSLYSEEQTNLAREQARATIEPISRQIIAGEVIVRRGQIIREEDLEALNIFGLAKPSNQTDQYVTNAILVGVLATLSVLYFNRRQDQDFYDPKHLSLIAIVFVIFLGLGRFLVIDRTIVPYLYPVAAFGLTIAIIYNFEFGTFLSLFLSILLTFGKNREAELTIFYLLPTMLGMLTIGRARHIGTFIGSGFVTGLLGTAVVAAFRLGDVYTDMVGLSTLVVASLVNGVISGSFALLLQYIFAQILDIPTTLQLIDISRPDHPLLQYILQNAPGSYQHSLLVANLCEQAAGAIGADRLLIRVGALFHDCGKANNPQFFVENQVKDKIDAHDDLDPATAAATIIQHVPDGVALAKKYRLPSRIIDFIREHHGTMLTVYQYSQAVAVAESPEEVDKSLFTYPGPKPQSRETAILMLADGTEARARADAPRTDEELRDLIQKSIAMYKDADQLEETDLTLKDLKIIEDSFFETLQRSYHPRIKYPQVQKKLEEQTESALAEE